jgi:menaquinone-specific isochorismate synthase
MNQRPGERAALRELREAAAQVEVLTVEVEPRELGDMFSAAGRYDRLYTRAGAQLLGTGEALRIPLPAGWAEDARAGLVDEVLGSIGQHEGRAVAIGALPYDPDSPGHLVVPRLLLKQAAGRAWATLATSPGQKGRLRRGRLTVGSVRDELARLREDPSRRQASSPEPMPDRFRLSSTMPHPDWLGLVEKALVAIENGELKKVVLARRVEVLANKPIPLSKVVARLASLYPACTVFHVEGFIGASPETLLQRDGTKIMSHPLAGTVARSGDPATDDDLVNGLLSSEKERLEHDLVVDAVASRLRPLCTHLEVPATPTVVALRNVSHLGTVITGALATPGGPAWPGPNGLTRSAPNSLTLPAPNSLTRLALNGLTRSAPNSLTRLAPSGPSPEAAAALARAAATGRSPTSLELAALLHPTPAVGGHPVAEALQWQRDNEGFDRGCYAGPVGWVDSAGDGEWVLGLRSAVVSGRHAALYAGAGIVAGSDPTAELAETQLKLQALLAAIVRP